MRRKSFLLFRVAIAVAAIISVGAYSDAYSQGRGHGKGGAGGRGKGPAAQQQRQAPPRQQRQAQSRPQMAQQRRDARPQRQQQPQINVGRRPERGGDQRQSAHSVRREQMMRQARQQQDTRGREALVQMNARREQARQRQNQQRQAWQSAQGSRPQRDAQRQRPDIAFRQRQGQEQLMRQRQQRNVRAGSQAQRGGWDRARPQRDMRIDRSENVRLGSRRDGANRMNRESSSPRERIARLRQAVRPQAPDRARWDSRISSRVRGPEGRDRSRDRKERWNGRAWYDGRDQGRDRIAGSWAGAYNGYKNYGQYRSAEVHARNAERRAARDGLYYGGYYDRYDRSAPYYDDPYYYETRYSVIRNIVRTRGWNSYYDDSRYYPTYSSYYYGTPYEPVYGSPFAVNCAYYGFSTYYYDPYPSYVSYVPQYGRTYYDPYPASYGYYYEDIYPSYVSYDYIPDASYGYNYGYYDSNPYVDVISQLPVGDLVYELTGNSFVSELLGSFLNQGYDQGYLDGLYAREAGYGEEYYYDPYAYHDTSYDAYSLNLAENRRIFSEGYEAGYRDALLDRRDDYYPYEDSQPDLVGLLVGNVLSDI